MTGIVVVKLGEMTLKCCITCSDAYDRYVVQY
jgi:hypothetical protein